MFVLIGSQWVGEWASLPFEGLWLVLHHIVNGSCHHAIRVFLFILYVYLRTWWFISYMYSQTLSSLSGHSWADPGSPIFSTLPGVYIPYLVSHSRLWLCCISTSGPANPVQPQHLMNISTHHDRATVQWSISYIAYTPETYTVNYGSAMNWLGISAIATQRGDNFTIHNQLFMFSAELTGLSPGVTYYYQVEAQLLGLHF